MLKKLLAFTCLTLSVGANAALIGAEVNLSAYFPDSMSVYEDGGDAIVSNSIEYSAGFVSTYNPFFQADITDSQFILTWTSPDEGEFQSTDFNGFILEILAGPMIFSASVDGSSAFSPIDLSVEQSGSRLLVNFSGVESIPASGSSIINISTSPVPIPAAAWLFGSALLGLGMVKRRKV